MDVPLIHSFVHSLIFNIMLKMLSLNCIEPRQIPLKTSFKAAVPVQADAAASMLCLSKGSLFSLMAAIFIFCSQSTDHLPPSA